MTSQKTDGDYAGAAEGDEKKKIKKTKAAKKEGKDGDEIREEKPRTGKACRELCRLPLLLLSLDAHYADFSVLSAPFQCPADVKRCG